MEFTPGESDIYGIVNGSTLLGVITAVDDVDGAYLEVIRENMIEKGSYLIYRMK